MYNVTKKIALTLLLIITPLIGTELNQKYLINSSVHTNTTFRTYDIKIIDEYLTYSKEESLMLEIPYSHIRNDGVITQLYYSVGIVGSAQWYVLQDTNGIVFHPNSISLPMGKWIDSGLRAGYIIRLVIMSAE